MRERLYTNNSTLLMIHLRMEHIDDIINMFFLIETHPPHPLSSAVKAQRQRGGANMRAVLLKLE
jgi:hypothetical protein